MPQDVKALVALGIRLAEAGRLDLARRYFAQALALDPENEEAWLWQGGLARDPRESLRCLETALAINPQSQRAKMGIQWARARLAANHLAAAAAPANDRAGSSGSAGATPADRSAAASELIPNAKGAAVASTTSASPTPPPPAAPNRSLPTRGLQALPLVAGVIVVLAILLTLTGLLGLGGLAGALAPVGASAMPSSTPTLIVIPTATPAPTPTVTPTPTNDDRLADLWRQLDGAWAQSDWPEAIRLIKQAQEIDPSYGDSTNKLFSAYFNYAMQMVEKDQLVQAVIFLDEALKLIPDDVNAQGERRLAMLYVEGEAHYNAGNWDEAIDKFAAIYEEDPDYKGDVEKLYASYYNKGYALEKTGRLVEAKQQYQLALQVNPNGQEAKAQLARLIAILTPPTPTPTPVPPEAKRIEVNLTTQRLIAWEGNRAVYQFPVTTGRPGSPTVPGNFQIRDKIESAYSNIWRLQLPYWMGIYWAGPIENGFHALPIDKNGKVLWGENLGVRPSSYGCIVLATADAAKLFNWANVGTRVIIHY